MQESGWGEWLVDDQRHAGSRTDVLVYQTEPLKEPVRIAGQPIAQLFASTSGTDADWVVKIIDVWPGEVPDRPAMGGYQQMLSADIFRGRYRTDFAKPQPLTANEPLPYAIPLPHASHTFLPGHRIMVQVQSSWFPLYDRNPQTLRAEHHVREARELCEGDATRLAHAGHCERDRAAGGDGSIAIAKNKNASVARGEQRGIGASGTAHEYVPVALR